MKTKLIYIAGPITGMPNENKHAFNEMQNYIESIGHKAINPHQIFKNIDTTGFTHSEYMCHCIHAMMLADTLVTLLDWYESKGAAIEVDLARKLDIPVIASVVFNQERVQ